MTNWKGTPFAKCQPGNERALEIQIGLRFEGRIVGEFCRNRLVGSSATRLHSPVHQTLGYRSFWTDRLLPDTASHAPGAGFGAQSHNESRNGSLFRTARKGRRSSRPCAHLGGRLLVDWNCKWHTDISSGAADCGALDQSQRHSCPRCPAYSYADGSSDRFPMARQLLSGRVDGSWPASSL